MVQTANLYNAEHAHVAPKQGKAAKLQPWPRAISVYMTPLAFLTQIYGSYMDCKS